MYTLLQTTPAKSCLSLSPLYKDLKSLPLYKRDPLEIPEMDPVLVTFLIPPLVLHISLRCPPPQWRRSSPLQAPTFFKRKRGSSNDFIYIKEGHLRGARILATPLPLPIFYWPIESTVLL